mmetsp:Transcript_4962/g.15584  ORF Transcript_4962/g.15584 Transcript_4962/m.15584 type:complete len:344 (-) Transcript_4962:52-1083(-)
MSKVPARAEARTADSARRARRLARTSRAETSRRPGRRAAARMRSFGAAAAGAALVCWARLALSSWFWRASLSWTLSREDGCRFARKSTAPRKFVKTKASSLLADSTNLFRKVATEAKRGGFVTTKPTTKYGNRSSDAVATANRRAASFRRRAASPGARAVWRPARKRAPSSKAARSAGGSEPRCSKSTKSRAANRASRKSSSNLARFATSASADSGPTNRVASLRNNSVSAASCVASSAFSVATTRFANCFTRSTRAADTGSVSFAVKFKPVMTGTSSSSSSGASVATSASSVPPLRASGCGGGVPPFFSEDEEKPSRSAAIFPRASSDSRVAATTVFRGCSP